MTGESEPVEKYLCLDVQAASITEEPNLAFMGSNVISGIAVGVAVAVGNDTLLGEMAKALNSKPPKPASKKVSILFPGF